MRQRTEDILIEIRQLELKQEREKQKLYEQLRFTNRSK